MSDHENEEKSKQYQIRDDIPAPETNPSGRGLSYPWPQMKVGDSLYSRNKSACQSAMNWCKRKENGWRFLQRREGEKGYRIWRVE